jgi:uncharacterized protein
VTRTQLIVNLTRGDVLCVGQLADGPLSRMRGLIGRRGLPAGEGLLLYRAPAIHTAFMRFPIDAVFLDRELRVLGITAGLRPWRVASRAHARAVLELAAGESARVGLEAGHQLVLRDRRAASATLSEPGPTVRAVVAPESTESIIWPTHEDAAKRGRQPSSPRVLVVSGDRHFRSVTTMLLGHRGCSVRTTSQVTHASKLAEQDAVDVVVVDVDTAKHAASLTALAFGAAGLVTVGDRSEPVAPGQWALSKWGPFEDLLTAIERAADPQERSAIR